MAEIFSAKNSENANTFLLVLIYSVLIGSIAFFIYKNNSDKNENIENKENLLKQQYLESTGFISF